MRLADARDRVVVSPQPNYIAVRANVPTANLEECIVVLISIGGVIPKLVMTAVKSQIQTKKHTPVSHDNEASTNFKR